MQETLPNNYYDEESIEKINEILFKYKFKVIQEFDSILPTVPEELIEKIDPEDETSIILRNYLLSPFIMDLNELTFPTHDPNDIHMLRRFRRDKLKRDDYNLYQFYETNALRGNNFTGVLLTISNNSDDNSIFKSHVSKHHNQTLSGLSIEERIKAVNDLKLTCFKFLDSTYPE